MAVDDRSPTDPVAAAFARVAATMRTVPLEAQYRLAGTRLTRLLEAICNGLLVLGALLALAISTYALLDP